MGKKLLACIMAMISVVSCFSACDFNGGKGGGVDGDIPAIIAKQAHEEKVGYKFCGYFEDAAFTKRVTKTFASVPSGYYAKYQPDEVQAYTHSQTATGTYAYPSMTIEQVIYAEDYWDAVDRYIAYSHLGGDRYNSTRYWGQRYQMLGKDYTIMDWDFGAKNKNVFYDFHDEMEISMEKTMTRVDHEGIQYRYQDEKTFTYDTKWRAYLGEAKTKDGLKYYIVDDEYAVVVGLKEDECAENLVIPDLLDGKPVKQVSIYYKDYADMGEWKIKSIYVPSSVENAMIYLRNYDQEQVGILQKIEFAEGVRSIQVASGQTEDIVIPSTAYYVDLQRSELGYAVPKSVLFAKDQVITVNGGEHYYTEDGLLYSTEGDLVFQFGNRENINLRLNGKVKRVLRRSINGLAKNIHIPKNVEYFDTGFNEYSVRDRYVNRSQEIISSALPIFYLDSQTVLEQWANGYAKVDLFGDLKFLTTSFNYVIFGKNIDAAKIINGEFGEKIPEEFRAEVNEKFVNYSASQEMEIDGKIMQVYQNFPIRVCGDKIYAPKFEYKQYSSDLEKVWTDTPYSYLTEDFNKNEIFDSAVKAYYEYHNSQE